MPQVKYTRSVTVFALLLLAGGWSWWTVAHADDKTSPSEAAVNRTRKTVRMLDDIYKTTVVLITDKYVNDEDDFPAGGAAIALFDAVKKKGWHEVRLLDATGDPLNDENSPRDPFEKEAVRKLVGGEAYFERVIQKDGKPFLRAATPLPVVMKKCVMCHPHYETVDKGRPIGALSYTVPIE